MKLKHSNKKRMFYSLKLRFVKTPLNLKLIFAVLFLNVFGLIMIYSSSYYYGPSAYGKSPTYFFSNQLKYVLAGLLAMITVSLFRPDFIKKFYWPFLFIAIGLCVAVRIPGIGYASHGAYRWIKIGPLTLQVAEPVKVALIIFLAGFMSDYDITKRIPIAFVFFITIMISLMQYKLADNFSTAVVIFGVMYLMLLMRHPKPLLLFIFMIIGFFFAVVIVFYILNYIPYSPDESFRLTRIRAWRYPNENAVFAAVAEQATKAKIAIASGGFFGKGLGKSLIKLTMPEPHNDYILAIVFEELGVFGVIILTFLFIYLLYQIYKVYKNTSKWFRKMMVLGVFFHLALQIVLNYSVTLGLLPTSGVTLTFISAGGSAAFFTLIEIGIVLSVDRENSELMLYSEAKKKQEEDDPEYLRIKNEIRERKGKTYDK